MIDLKDKGELIACEEYCIINNKVHKLKFITKDIKTNLLDKFFYVESQSDISGKYYTSIKTHIKDDNEDYKLSSDSSKVFDKLSDYIDFVEFFVKKKNDTLEVPVNVYNSKNTSIHNNDQFGIDIKTLTGHFITNISDDCKIIQNGSTYNTINNNGEEISKFIVYKDSILFNYIDEFNKTHFRLFEIRDNYFIYSLGLDDFNPIMSNYPIPNLYYRAGTCIYNNKTDRFEYDMIQSNDSNNKTKMKRKTLEIDSNNSLITLTSFHRVYYDMFDHSMNIHRDNLYCLDQLEIDRDETYYTRTFYIIDEETVNEIFASEEDFRLEGYDLAKHIIMKSLK